MPPYHVHKRYLMTPEDMRTNFPDGFPTAYQVVYRADEVQATRHTDTQAPPLPGPDTAGEVVAKLVTTLTEQACIHEHSMKPGPINQGLCPRCITLQVKRLLEQLNYETLRTEHEQLRTNNLKMTELCLETRDQAGKFLRSHSIHDFEQLERLTTQLNQLPEALCPISFQLIQERLELKEQLARTQHHLEEQQQMTYLAVQREQRGKKEHLADQMALAGWIQAAHRCGIGDPHNLVATLTTHRPPLVQSAPSTDSPDAQTCGHGPELQALRDRFATLQAVIDGAPVIGDPSQGEGHSFNLALTHPAIPSLLRTLVHVFRARPETNYLEVTLSHPEAGHFLLTLRPAESPTPHDLRLAAEQEARILRQALTLSHQAEPSTTRTEQKAPPAAPTQPKPLGDPLDHSLETRQLLRDLFSTDYLETMAPRDAGHAHRLLQLLQDARKEGMGIAAILADAMRAATPANIAVAIRHTAGLPMLPHPPISTEPAGTP